MKITILGVAILSLLTAAARAQNENVTWQTPTTVSDAADVSTLGTYVGSWAPYDGSASSLPVNGVTFQGNADFAGFNSAGFDNGYNGFPNPGTPNNNYNSLLQYGAYDDTGNGSGDAVTWSDIPGHTYLIQIWVNGNAAGRSETVTGGANTSGTINYGSSPQYIIGTYVADASRSETITFSGAASGNGNYPQVNLLTVRDITIPPASITWQTPTNISGASDVSTQGTYFGSWAPYASSSLAVNGVTFHNSSDLPNFGNTGFNASYTSFPNPGTPDGNYNTLLQSGAYEYPGPACTFSWGGMAPGHTYLLEFWVNGNDTSRSETLTGGTNTSAVINYSPGQFITGTFVADNTGSETVTLNGAPGDNSPQVNLVQVRDITVTPATNYEGVVLADKPLGYWPLDQNVDTGSTATDLSGNGNSGTYYGTSPANRVAGPSPYITNAVSFNTAEVDLSSGTNTTLLDFSGPTTLEAWAQPADVTTFGDIIAKGYDLNNYQEIVLRENGGYGANYYGSLGGAGTSGGQQNTNWVYLVLSNDGSYDYLYINGTLVQKVADARGSVVFSDFVTWAIGNGTSGGNGRTFNGNLCQVALYNYGLTAAQVLNHYYAAEVNSAAATSAPIITGQPQAQAGYVGGSATFSVSAVSALPTTNQWFKGSTPLAGQTNSTLTLTDLQPGAADNYHVVVGNANGATTSVAVALTVSVPTSLQWSASGNNSTWDVDTTANWINLSNATQTVFNQGDAVLFDDTTGEPTTVAVNGTVAPSLITVNSSANNFNFSSGTISGSGSLVKEGTSTLTITNSVNLTGAATIAGGAVYAGNNSFASLSAITITNSSTLDVAGGTFNNGTHMTVSGSGLNGEGALFNSYGDDPQEQLNLTMAGDTTFGGSARWDMVSGAQINGAHNLTLDWSAGAGYSQWNSITIGASVTGITLTNGGTLGMSGMDTSCQNPATVLNISTNGQLVLYSGGFNGSVSLYSNAQMTVYSGNVNLGGSTLHLYSGATMSLYASGIALTGNSLIFENGALLQTYYNGGINSISNQVTLNGVAHLVLGDHSENFSGVMSGAGGFVLDYYNNEVVLSATNTYSGPTIIGSSGNTPEVALTGTGSIANSALIFFGGNDSTVAHLDVTGRSDQTLTLSSGQTLAGVGSLAGNLAVSAGAVISPAGTNTTIGITTGTNVTGTLAVTGNIGLNGTTVIKLNGATNDLVQAGGNITYGGTLNLANVSGSPLTGGQSFQIFNAANYIGSFTTITPATPGAGMTWNTNQLASGMISVIGGTKPVISNITLSGGNVILSGNGGAVNGTYYVVTTTNLLTPEANWTVLSTNMYDSSGNFSVTNAVSAGVPQQFYMLK